tara:strand:+ start:617 stop:916 length:300 start_codon:yes stop_codon:yes gene_type:complete
MIHLVPLIRINRALSACYLIPQHPIHAIAISECISVIGPLFNPILYNRIIGMIIAMAYSPSYAIFYIKWYIKHEKIYYQTELIFLLLFNFIMYKITNIY